MTKNEDKKKELPIFQERLNAVKGDLTIDRFARKVGVARATMGGYLAGTRLPKADHLKQIAEKCGVSADYLIGLSDAQSTDNRDISMALGLSDEAIEVLRQAKGNPFRHFSYDRIITDKVILPAITQYLCAFLEYERLNSRYKVVPSYGLSNGYADKKLVAIMTRLPEWKETAIAALKERSQLMEQLLLEYVASVVDERECNIVTYRPSDEEIEWMNYDPTEYDEEHEEYWANLTDKDIDELVQREEELKAEAAIEAQKERNRIDIIEEVLAYRRKKK